MQQARVLGGNPRYRNDHEAARGQTLVRRLYRRGELRGLGDLAGTLDNLAGAMTSAWVLLSQNWDSTDPQLATLAVRDAERRLAYIAGYIGSGDVVVSQEASRAHGVLAIAINRARSGGFQASMTSGGGGPTRSEVLGAIGQVKVTGDHIAGLAVQARDRGVDPGDLVRPEAIAAGEAADRETGTSQHLYDAARAEEERIRQEQCRPTRLLTGEIAAGEYWSACAPDALKWVLYGGLALLLVGALRR